MRVKDNTPAQTERWVIQEAAKHTDRASIVARIASERSSIKLFAEAGFDKTLPNSHKAHYKLIEVLEKRLAEYDGVIDAMNGADRHFGE